MRDWSRVPRQHSLRALASSVLRAMIAAQLLVIDILVSDNVLVDIQIPGRGHGTHRQFWLVGRQDY